MKIKSFSFVPVLVGLSLVSVGFAAGQLGKLGELIKGGGVALGVSHFGPQINSEINKIAHTPDTPGNVSKVVPIITAGINDRKSVGAAQIRGPRAKVDKVVAVAQIDQGVLGNEVKVRILLPVSSQNVVNNLKLVPGVGVTGIVDLKLRL